MTKKEIPINKTITYNGEDYLVKSYAVNMPVKYPGSMFPSEKSISVFITYPSGRRVEGMAECELADDARIDKLFEFDDAAYKEITEDFVLKTAQWHIENYQRQKTEAGQ